MTQRPHSFAPNETAFLRGRGTSPASTRLFRYNRTFVAVAFVSLMLCLLCAWTIDLPIARLALQSPPPVRAVAQIFSNLGLSNYMLILSGLAVATVYGLRRRSDAAHLQPALGLFGERAIFIFATVAVSGIIAQILKHLVGRARPKGISTLDAFHFDLFSIKASLASFPSGHSTSIFALAAAVALIVPRLRIPAFALAGMVALARVVLAAHFASDVVAGASLGLITTLALAGLFADRSIAFTRDGGMLRLKGRGLIWSALRGQAPRAERGA